MTEGAGSALRLRRDESEADNPGLETVEDLPRSGLEPEGALDFRFRLSVSGFFLEEDARK